MNIIYPTLIIVSSIMFLTFLPIITLSPISAMGAAYPSIAPGLNTKSLVFVFKKSCYGFEGRRITEIFLANSVVLLVYS